MRYDIHEHIVAWVRLQPRAPHAVFLAPREYGDYLQERVWKCMMCDPEHLEGIVVKAARDKIDPPLQMRHRRDPLLFGASA
jgi:hypothetical protein